MVLEPKEKVRVEMREVNRKREGSVKELIPELNLKEQIGVYQAKV